MFRTLPVVWRGGFWEDDALKVEAFRKDNDDEAHADRTTKYILKMKYDKYIIWQSTTAKIFRE